MSEPIGRAGMDVAHVKHGEGGNRANRQRLLQESMRELDPAWTAKQAARNENVDPARTSGNIAMVNDGQGGFRPCTSVEDVLDYGDAREARVRRKIDENSFATTTIVGHLPKSMCEEKSWVGGDGKTRTYWAAKDPAEMRRYFDELVAYLGGEVVRGGQAALHGYDINVDEYTPHIQIMLDNYATDPKSKDPAKDLRVIASQNWGSHREVRDDNGRQISGPRKMTGYQAGLRAHMLAAGFPVEADVDPVRSKRKQSKADYVELQEREGAVAVAAEKVAAKLSVAAKDGLAARDDRMAARAELAAVVDERSALAQARSKLDDELDLVPAMRRRAVEEGRREGYEDGRRAALDEAEESARFVAAQRSQASQDAEAARVARRVWEEREKALAVELERLQNEPADFKVFLDTPLKDGRTMRAVFNRTMAPVREKRARRMALLELDQARREGGRGDAERGPTL